jgi:hypothetical protein
MASTSALNPLRPGSHFTRFAGTMRSSDSSQTCTPDVRPNAYSGRPLQPSL